MHHFIYILNRIFGSEKMSTIDELSINTDNIIAAVTSTIAAVYTLVTNTKKYELTENYRCELMEWYKLVVQNMIEVIHLCEMNIINANEFRTEKVKMLSQLSSLMEIGRFYFPNVLKNDSFGSEKPKAYQGYRHINLEFIICFYDIVKQKDISKDDIGQLWDLEREFTSFMFDMIKPRKRNKDYTKYLSITIPKGQSIEDYIAENPENAHIFR